ncbi:hypothetical protein [Campylobacter geochelonis]|uniref:Mobilization protein n=1 Tax=Campylobacter geochelonis TaxID=1780362 RepID=A0A128EIF5_9BACT|nr:hypothetical protein [Campylobacter geochelonis]QKF70836.1 hypothetical protein CGEO_0513 [Campylobacter geochelonis]CZE48043.1 mobilization protein [Campylobacter geochelonis]
MARKSSGNIQKALRLCFEHMFREGFLAQTVFPERLNLNEYSSNSTEARKKWKKMQEESREKYKKRVGRYPKWSSENTLQEMVVNLDENCNLETLQKIAETVEKTMGYRCLAMAVHRDEGYYDSEGKFHTNFHGHLVFFSVDENGMQLTRENFRHPQKMRDLQTQIAEISGLERGEIGSKRKRLEHKQYKIHIKAQEEAVKPLKIEIKALKNELERLKNRPKIQANYKEDLQKIELELNAKDRQWRDLFARGCSAGNSDLYKVIIDQTKSEIEQLKLKKQEIQDKIKATEIDEATENHKSYSEKIETTTQNKAQNALKSAVWSNYKEVLEQLKADDGDQFWVYKSLVWNQVNQNLKKLQSADLMGLTEQELEKLIDDTTSLEVVKDNFLLGLERSLGYEANHAKLGFDTVFQKIFWNLVFIAGVLLKNATANTKTIQEPLKADLRKQIEEIKELKTEANIRNARILQQKQKEIESLAIKIQDQQNQKNDNVTISKKLARAEIKGLEAELKAKNLEVRTELQTLKADRKDYSRWEYKINQIKTEIEALKKDIDNVTESKVAEIQTKIDQLQTPKIEKAPEISQNSHKNGLSF